MKNTRNNKILQSTASKFLSSQFKKLALNANVIPRINMHRQINMDRKIVINCDAQVRLRFALIVPMEAT